MNFLHEFGKKVEEFFSESEVGMVAANGTEHIAFHPTEKHVVFHPSNREKATKIAEQLPHLFKKKEKPVWSPVAPRW